METVKALSVEDHTRLANELQRVQWGHASTDEKCALFDELAERFGHNSLAESLEDFGL